MHSCKIPQVRLATRFQLEFDRLGVDLVGQELLADRFCPRLCGSHGKPKWNSRLGEASPFSFRNKDGSMIVSDPSGGPFSMKKLISLLTIGAIFGGISPSMAQQHKRISPHETVSKSIDGNRVMIVYGRPYTKDPSTGQNRNIWGELVPYGEVWRNGA